jgi:hypothetical protein
MTSSFVSRLLGVSIVGGFIALAAAPAAATALVNTSANSGLYSSSSNTPAEIANEPYLSARSKATANGASSNVAVGALPSCAQPGSCTSLSSPPEAGSYASANGNTGTLKVGAQAWDGGDARASARAALIDTVTLTSPIIKIFVDINALGPGTNQSPGQSNGDANIFFTMFIPPYAGAPSDVENIILFSFEVEKDDDGAFYTAYLRDDIDNPIETGNSAPGELSFSIDLSEAAFSGFIPTGPLDLGFLLSATADCDTSNCFSQARADESLYIQLQGSSANGYSYLGRGAGTDPDPNSDPVGVPEPMSALLLLSGLFGFVSFRRFAR